MPKVKLFIIGAASTAILVGLFLVFFGDSEAKETIIAPLGKDIYKITELEVGAIQDIVKETYIAGNPVTTTIKPVDKQGNFFYNEVMGMQKVVELKYKAIVRWGYKGEFDEKTVEYNEKEKILTIKEPQLTAFYAKELVESDENLGWVQSILSPTSYDEAKIYDEQANTVIEQTIRDNIQTGREKVQGHLKDEINKLIENETIKVPIRDIKFEESEEELDLVNKELEDL
ncbi:MULTISPECIES: hypothetical protein [unclassified Bacillus (in: firmicutes)]|uniref:hypothetical protein n=1 Tax=unclassified Bacillus (in: firmicutes) TaxID=185979 RepID=UPI00080AC311|nr:MULTISPECIES: hypothetical protein [unclassified Bacillus (in: firmicutes)]OCA82673.1 hypothetical protein A8L44_13890 [Bacillus sp. FJAT-27986]